eukprot:1130376-Rhodomonas_salina.3
MRAVGLVRLRRRGGGRSSASRSSRSRGRGRGGIAFDERRVELRTPTHTRCQDSLRRRYTSLRSEHSLTSENASSSTHWQLSCATEHVRASSSCCTCGHPALAA